MALTLVRSDNQFLVIEAPAGSLVFAASTPLGHPVQTAPNSLISNVNYVGFEHPPSSPLGIMVSQGVRLTTDTFVPDRPRSVMVAVNGGASIVDPMTFNDAISHFNDGAFGNATVVQAGPRLVRGGVVLDISLNPELFSSDSGALAFSDHVAIGVKADDNLIFVYASQTTVQNLAASMKGFGAVDAIKCDGGAGAFLQANVDDTVHHRGVAAPFTALTVA
jgi:hypothetical protein